MLDAWEPEERDVIETALTRAAEAAECWCLEGAMQAMNRFNRFEEEVSES